MAVAGVLRFLEIVGEGPGAPMVSPGIPFEKNRKNHEIFICIFEKMGYNRMESS
jgi:hypothetical protein